MAHMTQILKKKKTLLEKLAVDLFLCGIDIQKCDDDNTFWIDVPFKTGWTLKQEKNKILLYERYDVIIHIKSYRDLAARHQYWNADRKYRGWTNKIEPPNEGWKRFYDLAGFDWLLDGVNEGGKLLNPAGTKTEWCYVEKESEEA